MAGSALYTVLQLTLTSRWECLYMIGFALEAIFAAKGRPRFNPLIVHVPDLEMAEAILAAIEAGSMLAVEAGTGTGKTFAYLVPALLNGGKVIISTGTKNLQDQLFQKDLPMVRDALKAPVSVALLKGRANYLCVRRWRRFLVANLAGEPARILAARIAIWVRITATGDRNELALDDAETAAWNALLAADVLHCTSRLCPENRSGRCWVARARRRAASSHLVIVNHALLLTDLATAASGERGVLPEYAEAIIDEAHHATEDNWRRDAAHRADREVLVVLHDVEAARRVLGCDAQG